MKKIVVDSSVVVKWLHQESENYVDQANNVLKDVQDEKVRLLAPILAKYEIGNVLVKKGLTTPKAIASLATVYSLPVDFMLETYDLSVETYIISKSARDKGYKHVTYYDASFMALAKQENAALVTDNPKHQAKVEGVEVIALKDYK